VLGVTPETYNSSYPSCQSLTSPSSYVFKLAVSPSGVMEAIYFEPDEDFWVRPYVQPFDPVVTVWV
jgi:hypothetical protein